MLNVNEVKQELGIDFDDSYTEARIKRYITLADIWLQGAISKNYPKDDERAKQLALLLIEDMYDRNSNSVKSNNTIEKLKIDFILQLQCEQISKDDENVNL